jgi:hypothetical protein
LIYVYHFCFSSKTFELNGFKQLVDQIAASKKVPTDQIVGQLGSSGGPSLANVTVRYEFK